MCQCQTIEKLFDQQSQLNSPYSIFVNGLKLGGFMNTEQGILILEYPHGCGFLYKKNDFFNKLAFVIQSYVYA
jgi:hypothetical protein